MKTKIGTEVAHVTRDSDATFKVILSKVNLQERQHAVAASRTACYTCGKTKMVSCQLLSTRESVCLHRVSHHELAVSPCFAAGTCNAAAALSPGTV